ncbi:hypothetical protein P168DRAFT_330261 [Aspergillus campestris IBT 28561]|uniref:Exonuclease domain-containing protein n=1 Tax=Aspergillus campestris (strain IBT 28561) TaxID=1392248 RepID=A0A2I1CS22_ASPC2|nr:uncharacterized protein P168DRAFT_330261 [Aspergillus campestris IBT 28561]PKY00419.1 hypothetical protein P168DRAFT_330261 [Aspergillus campestris IBT 28561]
MVRAPEVEVDRISAKENNNVEEPLANLEDQPRPLPQLRRGLYAPPTSFSKGDPDIEIGLRSALAALHTASDSLVGPGGITLFDAVPAKARADNPVAPVSVDRQEEGTNSARSKPAVPEVPAPWSAIPVSERDVLLDALQAQCHPIECLAGERYWTQTPSPADVDMTRQCNGCREAQRSRYADFIRKERHSTSKGCTVLSVHNFAAPDAKLGMMAPTPAYNQSAHKAIVLDCEMVGVLGANGRECSEVVRVSAVDFLSGEIIFDTYVSPQGHVISWRTKFSGVNSFLLAEKQREGKLINGWRAARHLLWRFIDAQTILIGHSLHHDLAVLGMVHTCVVDSATMTRVAVGEDCQRHWALKTLVRQFLDRDIQAGKSGHDCVEDTYATREVVLWCLQNTTQLRVWAANERRIIAEKNKERELLASKPRDVASAN